MALAESWGLITSISAEQYRPPSPGYALTAHTLIFSHMIHKPHACITKAMHMQHTYAQPPPTHTRTQCTSIIYTFMASSKYSRVITLRNELFKGKNDEAKKVEC